MKKILVLGGYGNFGRRISTALVKAGQSIIISGRNHYKADAFLRELQQTNPQNSIQTAIFDVNKELRIQLERLRPTIVINTVGPFQNSDYSVAEACIQHNVHYIDLADGRAFVNGIVSLDAMAKERNVVVISGASTVPGLSSAVLAHYKNEFSQIESLIYGITPGQKTPRGLATVKAILSYLGRPLKRYSGCGRMLYGWQDLYCQVYPELGRRWMANCDIPDLDIFPERYGITRTRFSAGIESSLLHLGMWLLSYLVRVGLPLELENHAEFLLKVSNLFNCFGTEDGGMHVLIKGRDRAGRPKEIKWFLIAKEGDGPQIPCIPAIVLTKKLMAESLKEGGAMPCVELVTLEEYMEELKEFAIRQINL